MATLSTPRAPRVRRARSRQQSTARGWLTLFILIVVVGILSIGPGTLVEAIRGLTYVRPPTSTAPAVPLEPDADLQMRLQAASANMSHGRVSINHPDRTPAGRH